jgi:uncharacterized protein (DUF433 family)
MIVPIEPQSMNAAEIKIVDLGRGMQLSTSRITVQDLVPYFQDGQTFDEIIQWIPTLSREEIAVAERYYREHQAELDAQDRRIRERSANRKNSPDVERILERGQQKLTALREQFRRQKEQREGNGDNPSG